MIMAGMLVSTAAARTLNVNCGNITYAFPAEQMGDALYNSASGFTIMGRAFAVSEVSRMYVDETQIEDNTVSVEYSGESATVLVAGNIARLVDISLSGAYVSVTQSADTGDDTGEITYSLSGASTNGSFTMTGSYKSTIELRGVSLTSKKGAAIDIQNGKRIAVSSKNGTVNTFADNTGGSQKAAFYCKGHLELKGKGELNVTGNTAHAISANEYVEIKNCTVNVLGAQKDGINCTQYFLMESGTLKIEKIEGDGVQTDFKDTTDREAEDTGTITIAGGKITIAVTAAACKGIKAEGDVNVSGGEITVTSSAKGAWDSTKSKTKASSGIGADGDINITGGTLNLTASGSGGKGLSCDGVFTIDGGDIKISTTGGIFAYVNGKEYDGYTGNADNLKSDAKSSPKGIKSDSNININGGNIHVTTSGKGGEGIESKAQLTINDGAVFVKAYDDAINSSSHLYVKGGETTAISSNNDGLDSNGHLYIMGGKTMAFGGSSPECGIDANSEEGYTVYFTGGSLLAVGGGNSTPTTSASTQAYVSGSGTAVANQAIILKSGTTELVSFTVPAEYTSSGSSGGGGGWRPGGGSSGGAILITCPGVTSGQSYTLTNGSSSSNVTATQYGSGGNRPW